MFDSVENIAEFDVQKCHTYEELQKLNEELKNEDYFKKWVSTGNTNGFLYHIFYLIFFSYSANT